MPFVTPDLLAVLTSANGSRFLARRCEHLPECSKGGRAFDVERVAVGRDELEAVGVQHEARALGGAGVEDVALDGGGEPAGDGHAVGAGEEAGRGGMDAELVAAARDGLKGDAGAVDLAGENAVARLGGPSVDEVDDLHGAVVDVGAQREVDEAVVGGDVALEERGVAFLHGAALEHHGEVALGLGREGDQQQAGSLHVEPVNDHGARGVREHAAHAGDDAVGLVGPFSGNGEEAGWLVDDDEIRRVMEDGDGEHGRGRVRVAGLPQRRWDPRGAAQDELSLDMLTPLLLLATVAAQPPAAASEGKELALDWKTQEAPYLANHLQLTARADFVRAGEAYFSPDGAWIIFQAVPVPPAGPDGVLPPPDAFYSMYVAKLRRDNHGRVFGMEKPVRISPPGSANTCGWFHPTNPQMVIYGSTLQAPAEQQKPGFQVGTRKYVWMFPEETEVVQQPVFALSGGINGAAAKRGPARSTTTPQPLFSRAHYDAECSFSNDGRFVLYAHVEDAPPGQPPEAAHKTDANIYVFDTKTNQHIPLVTAPGYDGGPFFSPDGNRICYRSDRRGDDLLQIFVADITRDKNGVPSGISREYQLTSNENVNWAPYWHPSGKFLIYATSEVSHKNYEIFAVDADSASLAAIAKAAGADTSKGTVAVAAQRARITHADGADVLPVFSPDGSLMMWTSQRGDKAAGEDRPSSQLWIADVTGSPFPAKSDGK